MSQTPDSSAQGDRVTAVVAVLALAAVLVVGYTLDPHQGGVHFRCPFRALTGLNCPLCGATRCVHLLLHGHLASALRHNLLVVLAAPWVLWTLGSFTVRAWRGDPVTPVPPNPRRAWALLAVVVVFWVVRNLPWWPCPLLSPPR